MPRRRSDLYQTPPSKTAPESSGGCFSIFILPLVVALCFGLMMASASGAFPALETTLPGTVTAPYPSSPGSIAPLFTPEVQFWSGSIATWSAEHGVDPNLAATVMQIESCGNPEARSRAGATGLFQVMPFHFADLENMYDPATNALRGLSYLRQSLQTAGGDPRLALAGYNGGISVIGRSESAWAAETVRYAYWGSGIYAEASQNLFASERLNEWLLAGGASLCQKASQRLGLK